MNEPTTQTPESTVETLFGHSVTRSTYVSHDGKEWFYVVIQSPQAKRHRFGGTSLRCASEEAREAYIAGWKLEQETKAKIREGRLAEKRAAAASFVNPYKVGDILHSSWGYDQTNVEFFEVVDVRPRSICVRELAAKVTETGFMSGDIVARAGQYVSVPKWITIQISVYGGKVSHHVPSPIHGNLYPGKESHCSWYA